MDSSQEYRSQMKVEMKSLTLSEASKKKVRDTLEYLRGVAFSIKDTSFYKDKGIKLERQYWIDRGTLEVKGCINYSDRDQNSLHPTERANMFAVTKLLRYGFHRVHCLEALRACSGDVGRAYELLMSRYFNATIPDPDVTVSKDLLEERSQELQSLRSIYDDCCDELIANQVWVVNLELPYLLRFYPGGRKAPVPQRMVDKQKIDKNICRFFLRGHCKFSHEKCRFSHNLPVKKEAVNDFVDPDRCKFQLEIRFPAGCQYPLDPPLVSFLSVSESFPKFSCLRITERLMDEVNECCVKQLPCVYELISLLKDKPEEIEYLAAENPKMYYDPSLHLIKPEGEKKEDLDDSEMNLADRSNIEAGSSVKYLGPSEDQIIREDNELCQKFIGKQKLTAYRNMREKRMKLPAWEKQNEILECIKSNQLIVISGDTGCGKSTQVPQFILDDWLLNRKQEHVEIVCTQPRRISAIGVAERVASERAERVGGCVGYQIRLENRTSSSTRLSFCTMGILLRRLEADFQLRGVSHVIVDEVHERSEESDFLLLILRDVMKVRKDLKVILMSATLNPTVFCEYFGGAPIIDIPGRTFPVEQLFLEDILELSNYSMEEYSQYSRKISRNNSIELDAMDEIVYADLKSMDSIPNPLTRDELLNLKQLFHRYKDYSPLVKKCIFLNDVEKINNDLIEHVLSWIVNGDHNYPREGSILVFLPGLGDIKALYDQLCDHPYFSPRHKKFELIPLHSSLTNEEQSLVFRTPKPGVRKIILSTNIAETSITIDDCVFVIDTGKKKEKMFDNNKNMESLETVWVARANAIQRKGRAGRVMPGVCIHLFTSHRFEYTFRAQPIPEIQRAPLEQLILKIKLLSSLSNKDIYEVLDSTIEPPERDNVTAAIVRLINVGALNHDNSLTALGHHLASLPVDVRIGKFILLGTMLCCLDSALTIAASLSYKSPFLTPFNKKNEANTRKKEFITGHSDHLTILKAYNSWREYNENGRQSGNHFANNNYLSIRTLNSLSEIKVHLLELLMDIGFIPSYVQIPRRKSTLDKILEITGSELNTNGKNQNLLAAIMCAALYPNIVKVLTPEKIYTHSITGAIPNVSNPQDIKFKTKEDGYVFIHPSSVNHNVGYFPNPYLVYQEKVKTSKIFIRDCTVVPVLPLVLFSSSKIKVELVSGTFVVSMDDGWIMFTVPNNEVAELMETIKKEFLSLLDEKIKNPSMDLLGSVKGKKIISTIVYLITYG